MIEFQSAVIKAIVYVSTHTLSKDLNIKFLLSSGAAHL